MILCCTGWSCSGKTTVSNIFKDTYNYSFINIREVSHSLAIEKGFTKTREWLLSTTINNYLTVCRNKILELITSINNNIIIDDLFDYELYCELIDKFKRYFFRILQRRKKNFLFPLW